MSWIRAFRFQSFAQYFCILSIFMTATLLSEKSLAAKCTKANEALLSNCYNDDGTEKTTTACRTALRNCTSGVDPSEGACNYAKQAAENAKSEFTRACGEAGLGSKCVSQMKKCAATAEAEEYQDSGDVLEAFSAALGVPQTQVGSQCPKYSGQGYFERKDKYENDLDDINDKLNDIKEQTADLNDKLTEDTQQVQEDIADAQKDYEELATKTKENKRNRAAEQAKTAADIAKSLRSQQSFILQKRQDIANIYRSKNSSLIAMSEAATKRACIKKVREAKKEYDAINSGSTASVIARASQKKKALQAEYDECMSQFDQQRIALMEQTDQKVQNAQDAINTAQSEIDDMNQQLASMKSQETEAANDEQTTLTQAQTALSQKISRATTKLQSLQTTAQAKAKALAEKQTYYQQKSTAASNALASLGPVPADETSTTKISVVESAYENYVDAAKNANFDGCSYSSNILGTASSSSNSSKSNSRSSKGSR